MDVELRRQRWRIERAMHCKQHHVGCDSSKRTSSVVITNDQRTLLNIKNGPDSPVDFFQTKNGQYYINSSGELGVPGNQQRTAWNMHVDSQLTQVLALNSSGPAAAPSDVLGVLRDHEVECGVGNTHLPVTAPGGPACSQYFDRDYSGGGSYFLCPDQQTSVYFYHGENHTAPDGTTMQGGWFGIGVGYYNSTETAVTRAAQLPVVNGNTSAQVLGMNLSTIWQYVAGAGYPTPPQADPYNDIPSAVAGKDGYLYLFSGNASFNPEYDPGPCGPGCSSISRAPISSFCSGIETTTPVPWTNYYNGTWIQPAVQDASAVLGFGSGGLFTPFLLNKLPGEHQNTVSYIPTLGMYVTTGLANGSVLLRVSADGFNWSSAQVQLPISVPIPSGTGSASYPKFTTIHDSAGHEQYILTYTLESGSGSGWAELIRQPLTLSFQ